MHEVKNIKKAILVEENGRNILKTEGINIEAMFEHPDILDLNRLTCNNIHDMAR